ncbi:type I-G CRISPR-associated protein Cas8g1/Csx17 [Zavarzinella formosa]|uniref:type I-G CRISPR-associated protein Cas8g1/Csx17 n=1 Tax=Zavarzinella formosa TaxID=360055 RepID=UPI0002FFF3CA|nr:type I-U CRISPR-associated protein Csx17 [Zavarzinella formosa]
MNELILEGCTPEPLMGYLKALGVLRLVSESEQADPDARGFWRDGVFVLQTKLDGEALAKFFREQYEPTPIVVPWSGGDFFGVRTDRPIETFPKVPTSSAVIEAVLATKSPRLANYRVTILETLAAMRAMGITQKSHIEGAAKKKVKASFLARLRSVLPDSFLGWIDAAAQLTDEAFVFNSLLGSGGGSDGNTHFSDNFMQNLWECLPEFDGQRSRIADPPDVASVLFGTASRSLRQKRTASLFDSGAVGGPNAGMGLERDSLLNPWNFVLALEGCVCLAGAVVKRQQVSQNTSASFPFAVRMTATGFGSGVDKEQGQNEIWLPLWDGQLSFRELEYLLETGRCEVGRRPARTGLDFARAIAGLGVDAGISSFARYAIVRGRVGGDNYNTAVSAGQFAVRPQPDVGLLESLDKWLDAFRYACRTKDQGAKVDPPSRFPTALRRIESAVFDFCKYGGKERLASILAALGNAERQLALGNASPDNRRTHRPLAGLDGDWLSAADDGSPEFRLARGIASLNPGDEGTGPVRRYLEPVEQNGKWWVWGEGGGHVVWNQGGVVRNLGAMLVRRLMDAEKNGEAMLPLGSPYPATLKDIEAFLADDVDEDKLEELIWGLSLVDRAKRPQPSDNADEAKRPQPNNEEDAELPRSYALLKLCFLQGRLEWTKGKDESILRINSPWRRDVSAGVIVKPEPTILAKLRAGDVQGACEVAARRLRVSGSHFSVVGELLADGRRRAVDWTISGTSPERLLAALSIPIPDCCVNQLADLVLRQPVL